MRSLFIFSALAMSMPSQSQVIEHSSNMCLRTADNSASPSNGTQVVLSNICSGRASEFNWTSGGSIKHIPSNKCVHPGGAAIPENGAALVLWDGCDFADRVKFTATGQNSIQHVSSNKCVHPNGGAAFPAEGTSLVMWEGCNESRLAFEVNTTTTPQNSGGQQVANVSALISAIASANSGDVITF